MTGEQGGERVGVTGDVGGQQVGVRAVVRAGRQSPLTTTSATSPRKPPAVAGSCVSHTTT